MYRYRAFALGIASDIPFPELSPGDGEIDVAICRLEAIERHSLPDGEYAEPRSAAEWRLMYDDVGLVTIRDGARVEIAPVAGVDARTMRQAILGPALAVLLQQRGYLVLHASVVRVGGGAIAFLGDSGSGKSTIAAALHARGHELISDDLAAIRLTGAGPEVLSAFPQFKLWPDSVTALRMDPAGLPIVEPGFSKRVQRVTDRFTRTEATPLRRLYLLGAGPCAATAPLSSADAFIALVRFTYGVEWLHAQSGPTLFQQRAALARAGRVSRLTRPWRLTALEDAVDMLEADEDHDAE